MKFEKKLIILGGDDRARGTLSLERNAYGVFATVNIYNLVDRVKGEYRIGIKTADAVHVESLGSKGRILKRFEICDLELPNCHGVVFNSIDLQPLLYGTASPNRLWKGNQMDGLKRLEKKEKEQLDLVTATQTIGLPNFSSSEKDIKNYFFDIIPGKRIESEQLDAATEAKMLLEKAKKEAGYNDTMLAEVNYFAGYDPLTYSTKESVDKKELLNPVDRYLQDEGNNQLPFKESLASTDSVYEIKPDNQNSISYAEREPWQLASSDNQLDGSWNLSKILEKYHAEKLDNLPERSNDNNLAETLCTTSDTKDYSMPSSFSFDAAWHTIMPKTLQCAPANQYVKSLANHNSNKIASDSHADTEVAFTVPPASSYTAAEAIKSVKTNTAFYDQIKSQLDDLFKQNESYPLLEELMPQTKWTKVNFDEKRYYVVGVVGNSPDYICYGVPSNLAQSHRKS